MADHGIHRLIKQSPAVDFVLTTLGTQLIIKPGGGHYNGRYDWKRLRGSKPPTMTIFYLPM